MRPVGMIACLVAALAVLVSPAATVAAEVDARILSVTPGFRQSLVDVTSLRYDAATGVARLTLTVHCFVGYYQVDAETVEGPFVSELEFGQDGAVVQRSKPIKAPADVWASPDAHFADGVTIADAEPCAAAQAVGITAPDHVVTFTFTGVEPGFATFVTTINTGIFSGHVSTSTLINAVLPPR